MFFVQVGIDHKGVEYGPGIEFAGQILQPRVRIFNDTGVPIIVRPPGIRSVACLPGLWGNLPLSSTPRIWAPNPYPCAGLPFRQEQCPAQAGPTG
ncbi:MAG: hypothetical protein HQP61_07920 [Peptococcaceae bacterium]|nr:hypothetical protein [Candidatus Syntrophopropionicum ammoniitolerans]